MNSVVAAAVLKGKGDKGRDKEKGEADFFLKVPSPLSMLQSEYEILTFFFKVWISRF